jgi:hypothetical protein
MYKHCILQPGGQLLQVRVIAAPQSVLEGGKFPAALHSDVVRYLVSICQFVNLSICQFVNLSICHLSICK